MQATGRRAAIGSLDHEDVAAFMASPAARMRSDSRPKKATSMNTMRSSLRTFFAYVHAAGFVRANAARLIRRARCAPPPPRGLSQEEQARLLAVLRAGQGRVAERDFLLVHLLSATGIRLGSALALEASDVELKRRELVLRCTKGDRPDVVMLGGGIRAHLRRYLRRSESGFLFAGRHGLPLCRRQAQHRFSLWLKRAGIEWSISPHACRHAFAQDLYRRTGNLFLVQEALRHRSIGSTLVYAAPNVERLRRALAARP